MLACAHPTFDCPVILFQNIIEVLHRAMPAILLQSTHGFEPHDSWWITGVLVGIDYARRRMASEQKRYSTAKPKDCVQIEDQLNLGRHFRLKTGGPYTK